MTAEEARIEIERLKKWLKDERDRVKAGREATLVEAFLTKKRLCRMACRSLGLDQWQLEGRNLTRPYTSARALIYWKMSQLGYTCSTIAEAWGRDKSISRPIGFMNAKLNANPRLRNAAERVFEA